MLPQVPVRLLQEGVGQPGDLHPEVVYFLREAPVEQEGEQGCAEQAGGEGAQ